MGQNIPLSDDDFETAVRYSDKPSARNRPARPAEMTRDQRRWLQKAADLKPGEYLTWGIRSNAGGALHRLMDKMKAAGWLKGPPWIITAAGRKALK
jgi:hypothetical protein